METKEVNYEFDTDELQNGVHVVAFNKKCIKLKFYFVVKIDTKSLSLSLFTLF